MGQDARTKAVVDVDDRHSGCAGIQHGEQSRQTLKARAIADARRDRDHRSGHQSAHDGGQDPVHASDHDEHAGCIQGSPFV
jgi:hypothetical protein